jgi:hypothetical protein
MPWGPENRAVPPLPSVLPHEPGEPTKVLTGNPAVARSIFRMVQLYESAT